MTSPSDFASLAPLTLGSQSIACPRWETRWVYIRRTAIRGALPLIVVAVLIVNEMIDNPYETQSDSFYFVNGKLIMHNKASYKVERLLYTFLRIRINANLSNVTIQYFREDMAQAKKSYEDKFGSKVKFLLY